MVILKFQEELGLHIPESLIDYLLLKALADLLSILQ